MDTSVYTDIIVEVADGIGVIKVSLLDGHPHSRF